MKYSDALVDKICSLIAKGEHTQKEICDIVGIGTSTWHDWNKEKPEFSEALKRAEALKYERLKAMAVGGLKKLLEGHSYVEETRELRKNKETGNYEMTVTKSVTKFSLPNPTGVIFTLKNLDKLNFEDVQRLSVDQGVTLDDLSKEDLKKLVEIGEKIHGESNTDTSEGDISSSKGGTI